MLTKALQQRTDIYSMLMEYRNTALKNINKSPAQMMLNRTLRTKIPILENKLLPRVEKDIRKRKQESQSLQQYYYNKNAKNLCELKEGEKVYLRRGNAWQEGEIKKIHNSPRSYIVSTKQGEYRRNRRDLRPRSFESGKDRNIQNALDDNFDLLTCSNSNGFTGNNNIHHNMTGSSSGSRSSVSRENSDNDITHSSLPSLRRSTRERELPDRFSSFQMKN
ncbi:hypothetical protein JTB14_003856 [Gonioctena quinquepunctata]|nr:hypothetical protein JTB14_003856 [Gonioctena quinquepunctata]